MTPLNHKRARAFRKKIMLADTAVKVLQPGPEGVIDEDAAQAFISGFLGGSGVFLVAGPHAYTASGAATLIHPLLAGRTVVRFAAFSANPKRGELEAALQAFRESGLDRIMAVGGGSALDLGKLVNFFASADLTPEVYLQGRRPAATRFMPLLAVPTTAGTGSEATSFAVLYAGSVKHSIAASGLRPSHVLLNADFTRSLSPYQVACSGFDALAHAVESYWALSATAASRRNSLRALELVLEWLPGNVAQSTPQSRVAMVRGAFLAGQAINIAKTTAAHALSYSLTAHDDLPHGHAIAVFLPCVARFNVARMLLVGGQGGLLAHDLLERFQCATADELEERLLRLRTTVGLHQPVHSLEKKDTRELADRIINEVNAERLSNNPVTLDENELRSLVTRSLERSSPSGDDAELLGR